jgi:glycosyltransferase involved in cell wall biosynthesis
MLPVVIIPAYQPENSLLDVVDGLLRIQDLRIIVVNDGSAERCRPIFSSLGARDRVSVLHHAVNLGKGQALKTAFNHFLLAFPADCSGVVTADADGQHLVKDILRVQEALRVFPGALHLGSRQFAGKVPWKSMLGNALTQRVFRFFVGREIRDTQTGLRGIPRDFLQEMLQVKSTGYEFELEMLVRAARRRMPIVELPIETVYVDNNRQSHFNPLTDSLRIYFVFVRFSAVSMSTAVLDFLVFSVAQALLGSVLASIIGARIVAGSYNFVMNKTVVFKSRAHPAREVVKFASLVIILMLVAYGVVTAMHNLLGVNVYLAKVLAEGALFPISFALQDLLVFAAGSAPAEEDTGVDPAGNVGRNCH